MNKNHSKTPLFSALEQYSKKNITHFDVPGHKKNSQSFIAQALGASIVKLDANSTKELDMVSNPTGVIKECESLLADAYGADKAFLLVNGSTSGVQYMIMSACKPKEKILIPRNVHKSAINALIISGCVPIFLKPEVSLSCGISHGVTLKAVQEAVKLHPDSKAIFLMNPTYFGVVSDLKSIVEFAHKKNIAVLVDEAHGAHFPFHDKLPCNAMSVGADMATVSMHKTAGSLTQSSVLLLNQGILKKNTVRNVVNLMQTSSASYLLMASLDIARKNLVINGYQLYNKLLKEINLLKKSINDIDGLSTIDQLIVECPGVFNYDDTKIVIKVNELGLSGFELYDILFKEYNIQVELAESYVVLAIVGVGDNEKSFENLLKALKDISKRYYNKLPAYKINISNFLKEPVSRITPRKAHYLEKQIVKIEESVNRISGESIMIYPPGIPLVIPGEIITKEIVAHYQFYKNNNCVLVNDEENSGLIKVVIEKEEVNGNYKRKL
ncbi:aminotransferase class I/II-fold pyridoxal phosphate-dependent enzyme [Clostridium sp. 'deep sea']|uniref:aminotransferase class I/II-fold pyridoxal phosphate-dependent enzyme n=1 Tax=Clostridium sp. 'deep sea' TaxID=2779445 RepID=UPI0018968092|nr:aminotransferase class I/II-fold pyridoxal phosphate-dependent enzyme [Clostridium sp. 'deep sea']QOR35540.1 aminotransferase class I/II-fold pyridoxal phosphate-dependent enzyme [Clostridium sp. 'deep sea']